MKLAFLCMMVISFSAMGRSFEAVVREEKCNIEVTKDIIIPYAYSGIHSGSINISMSKVDNSNNRRLKAGRILKIKKLEEHTIQIDDAHVANLCVLDGYGGCADLYDFQAEKFESYSAKTLRLNCEKKPTIDI